MQNIKNNLASEVDGSTSALIDPLVMWKVYANL